MLSSLRAFSISNRFGYRNHSLLDVFSRLLLRTVYLRHCLFSHL